MTRKKWTKLKRGMPQLFGALPSWELMTPEERILMKPVSAKAAIARMHSLAMSSFAEFDHLPPYTNPNGWLLDCFSPTAPHPDKSTLPPPGWNFALDPAYPHQDYTVEDGLYQRLKPEPLPLDLPGSG